ncbi:MAG: pyridoxal phosphate-dependent class II aminotransferase [Synergistaceae bacterium]|nr:pyridoxal phosphate-dependent class II aminotransferase [Synergistaceae bacterium]
MTTFRLHGANPQKIYESFGIAAPEKIHDFSTNTNALSWDGEITVDMRRTLSDYPDDEATEVRGILAGRNGCLADEILVTSGSNETIYLIASYQTGVCNAILQPVYGEYLRALTAYGANTRNIMSLDELHAEDKTVWLCNPCNPTGLFISDDEIENILAGHRDKTFVVDEAYIDFMYSARSSLDFRKHPNLIIMRSLTKIYHLCGSRIGYVLARPETITRLKDRQPTWSVNSLAQSAAAAFLRDVDFPEKTRAYYREEMPRFISELKSIGRRLLPTEVNYFLMETANDEELMRFLLAHGIVVRHTRNFPGLDGKYVRVAARSRGENDIFISAMRKYMTR